MSFSKVFGIVLLGLALPVFAQNDSNPQESINQSGDISTDTTVGQSVAVPDTEVQAQSNGVSDAATSEPNEVAEQAEPTKQIITSMDLDLEFAKNWQHRDLTMADELAIRKAFEARFPGIKVDAINISPMPGIYEVQVGLDLLYSNAAVDYVLQGSLVDAKAKRDLTAERLDEIQKVPFDSLPLEHAVRQVKGTGEHVFAIFEDPNCGYCKELHKNLEHIDNTTIYSFLFPILAPDSTTKSRDIWCAEDPAKAWRDWMVNGIKPKAAECETPIKSNLDLGRKIKVQGTPAMFFPDGSRVNGALPLAALKQKFGQ